MEWGKGLFTLVGKRRNRRRYEIHKPKQPILELFVMIYRARNYDSHNWALKSSLQYVNLNEF